MNFKQHVIFITGAAGYVGTMLVDQFSKRSDTALIIALDKEPEPELFKGNKKIFWVSANTSDDSWQEKVGVKNPDIVIHAAWQIRELYRNKKTQWKWNIEGSKKVFNFAFKTPSVKRLIYFSTVASYGAFPENSLEHFFTEDEPFRESDYLYAEEKRIAEEILRKIYDKEKSVKSIQVSVIRPAAITGPRGRSLSTRFGLQSALSGALKGSWAYDLVRFLVSFVPATPKWCRQFVHEDDIVDIVALFSFGEIPFSYEVVNAAPSGPVVLPEDMAEAVGKRVIMVHPIFIRIIFFLMWHLTLGKIPTSKGSWKSYSYPIVVDGSKVSKKYGFRYQYQSKESFVKNEGRYSDKNK